MKVLLKSCADGFVLLHLRASSLPAVLKQLVNYLVVRELISPDDRDLVLESLQERERRSSSAIGHAVAVPHVYLECIPKPIVVIARLEHAANMGAPDGIPTRFVFLLLGPPEATAEHLDTLASIARVMSDDEFRYQAQAARTVADFQAALQAFWQRTAPRPPRAAAIDESMQFTGRLGGGLWRDIRRRLPFYVSDFTDGLNPKCIASAVFLFFACLAPAITFGGVMALLTEGQIGAVEMIVASAICGIAFALLSGQPLIILGGTGPLLVFTGILYAWCESLEIPFLPSYAWVGVWTAVILIVAALTDASCLMRYFTRFTDEIFAALISLIFIYEAIKSLIHVFEDLDAKQHHDTALLSLLLALGTFYIAMSLSAFRRSRYLWPQFREFLADFGPTIAIATMTLVAFLLHEVSLDVLPAPDGFRTTSGRAWTVSLWDAPPWVRYFSIIPALLVSVLVFLDQNITGRLVNSADHNLHKGGAYHLDLLVVGILIAVCSLFGLPWLVAATVRSLNHVRSLATTEERISAGGETKLHVLHVRENRITGLAIHLMLAVSLLLLPLLKQIPMAVLFGLFLFMGVVSMAGNQFFERLRLWLTDPALYPATHYMRRVPARVIHMFTMLQLSCLAILWIVKVSVAGILFPLFIAILVPVRMVAGRWFKEEHLAALDAEEEPEEEELQWA